MTEETIKLPSWIVKAVLGVILGGTVVGGGGLGGKAVYDQYKQDHDLLIELKTKMTMHEDKMKSMWRKLKEDE